MNRRRETDAAVLAAIADGTVYGYDLSRRLGMRSVRLYACLTRLENCGLIVGEFKDQGDRPARRAYRLTELDERHGEERPLCALCKSLAIIDLGGMPLCLECDDQGRC